MRLGFPGTPMSRQTLDDWHTEIINNLAADARRMANLHGYDSATRFAQFNAIEHTYVSAQVALKHGSLTATLLGNIKEWAGSGELMDSRRDQYNNEVGRRIAEWIKLNGLDEAAIDAAVLDALQNGKLVTGLDDPRIASEPPQEPDWRGPTNWPTSTQQLPDKGLLSQAMEDIKETFQDIRRWFEDTWDHAPPWLRSLQDLVRNILSDPLVLDLDGDGVEITSLASSTTTFDLDGDGIIERTGWVSPHDGLLVHDSNGNGLVDGVGELFGSANVDGYDELATLDSNHNGRIDTSDSAFADLKVWRDLNSDAVSTADEMMSLSEAGIAHFNLAYTQSDMEASGNVVARTGTYVRTDNSTRALASVRFALDQTGNLPEIPDNADVGNLAILPNLSGYASLPDLATAMYFDPVLKAMVDDLVLGAHEFETFQDFVDGGFLDVLYRWTGVDTSAPEDPNSPYFYQALEAMTGLPLVELNAFQRGRLAEIWPEAVKQFGVDFLFQAAQKPALEPFLQMLDDLTEMDPSDPVTLTAADGMTRTALAQMEAITPTYDYLDLFTGLEIDVGTGAISGDFDAFVERYLENQPSFQIAAFGSAVGTGSPSMVSLPDEIRHPWTAWYEDQGSLVFNVAAAMGLGTDYVLNVTGWRWIAGEMTTHHGSGDANLLDLTVTSYQKILFGSGTATSVQVQTRDQLIFGHGGDDELRGNDGVDRLVGGPGNDLLKGGTGSDMYVCASGDGLDRIVETSGTDDVLYFSSELDSADLRVVRLAGTDDLQLHFRDPAQGIVLAGQWTSSALGVEQFHFVAEDGLDSGDISSLWLATLATGGADSIVGSWASERIAGLGGADMLAGIDGDDVLAGGDGDDILWGDNGADALDGGSGLDKLMGGSGADSLAGGTGNDDLQGGADADTYVYDLGDGDDHLRDIGSNDDSAADTLVLGAGIAPEILLFSRVAGDWDDIRISFLTHPGSILIDDQHWGNAGIETVIFADGTVWNHAELMAHYVSGQQSAGSDTIHGSSLADVVEAGDGNDIALTGYGSDTLIGGRGNDRLEGAKAPIPMSTMPATATMPSSTIAAAATTS